MAFQSKLEPEFHLFGNSTGFSSELVGSVKVCPQAVTSFNGWWNHFILKHAFAFILVRALHFEQFDAFNGWDGREMYKLFENGTRCSSWSL